MKYSPEMHIVPRCIQDAYPTEGVPYLLRAGKAEGVLSPPRGKKLKIPERGVSGNIPR